MRSRRRIALLLASAAALGVGLIAFPASAAAAPPVVPTCTPKASTSSDSCVRGGVNAVNGPLGAMLEPVRLGIRVRSVFTPATDETTTVIFRYDDDVALNLAGIPTCPSSELSGKNIAQAYEQCGPGADGNPPSEGNAYLSRGRERQRDRVHGAAGGPGRVHDDLQGGRQHPRDALLAGAGDPATPGATTRRPTPRASSTVLFTGTITHQPAASPYGRMLTVPNTHTANPALDDFYATVPRGNASGRSAPPGHPRTRSRRSSITPLRTTDTISPPYAGTTQACPTGT